jgi:hypothetical protein
MFTITSTNKYHDQIMFWQIWPQIIVSTRILELEQKNYKTCALTLPFTCLGCSGQYSCHYIWTKKHCQSEEFYAGMLFVCCQAKFELFVSSKNVQFEKILGSVVPTNNLNSKYLPHTFRVKFAYVLRKVIV